jgi:hypothetical protein
VIGDYSHIKRRILEFVTKKSTNPTHILRFIQLVRYPSKWVTEIFIPVLSKIIPGKLHSSCKKSLLSQRTATDAIEPAKNKETSHKVHRRKKKYLSQKSY